MVDARLKTKRFARIKGHGPRGFSKWIQPRMAKYLMSCCDCGLVHEMQFRIAQNTKRQVVQFRARRAEGYTRQERKRGK